MNGVGHWLLAVVDGSSEASPGAAHGVRTGAITKIVERAFGPECAAGMTVRFWRQQVLSPLRERQLRGYREKATFFARVGNRTACGTLLLVDNDNRDEQARLAQLEQGANDAGLGDRVACGVARQMLETWLLADPDLRARPLPAGKACEALWGGKDDPHSHYPKHVLRRCVLEPRDWDYRDALAAWDPDRAAAHAPSLAAFLQRIRALAAHWDS